MYQGSSIVDYLSSIGQKSDFATRASLAASKGIQGYTGSAQQNTLLLNNLRGGQVPSTTQAGGALTSSPVPSQPKQQTPQPKSQPGPVSTVQPAVQNSIQTPVAQNNQPQSVADLVNMGFYGYQGWDNTAALADFKSTGGAGKGGASGQSISAPESAVRPTINLPDIYNSLYETSGIKDVENELSEKTKAYITAVSEIKDNPYLSEAAMTGRLRKLEDRFNVDTANIRNDISKRTADIEMQVNLRTKQFDIENEQTQQAISQFNSLLSSGALNDATAEDIASITRSTGISSNLIESAIKSANKKKLNVTTYDDGNNEYFVSVDEDGNISNKQLIGPSKSKASGTSQAEKQFNRLADNIEASAKSGITIKDLFRLYGSEFSFSDILSIYNANSVYGPAKEDIGTLKSYYNGANSTKISPSENGSTDSFSKMLGFED